MAPALWTRRTTGIGRTRKNLAFLAGVLALGLWTSHPLQAAELRESLAEGFSTQVRIELKAEGLFRPGLPPSALADEARLPKPLALEVKTRLAFNERIVKSAPPGGAAASERRRAARWVTQAASAINGEVRPTSSVLRPELSLLIAERAGVQGAVVVVSPSGPLTRPELELVQGPGDPLTLADLLPAGDVAKGHSWKLPASAAIALSGYDVVKTHHPGGRRRAARRGGRADPDQGRCGRIGPGGSGNDHVRRIPDVRPRGGPDRSARGGSHRETRGGTGRGRIGRQEHARR